MIPILIISGPYDVIMKSYEKSCEKLSMRTLVLFWEKEHFDKKYVQGVP